MNFQTKITIPPILNQDSISYASKLLLLGSCFSDHIGNKLQSHKFNVVQNPFGILFHPKAIENLIQKTIRLQKFTEKDIFFYEEQWRCFEAHSCLNTLKKEQLLENLNSAIERTYQQLLESTQIIITLGTSWTYRLNESQTYVANCHKVSQKKFSKELLTSEEIKLSLQKMITLIREINSKTTIIFTISPVRHFKDGALENTLSKSHLITAVHQLLNEENVCYFPSYEIMMDELRDYRFYDKDMLHPSQTAIDYIWEKFVTTWMDQTTQLQMTKVFNIQKAMSHQPFNLNSDAHQKFLKELQNKKDAIKKQLPDINF